METHLERRRKDELDSIAEQASGWLLELESGEPQIQEAFHRWVTTSPQHVEAFLFASTLDKLLTQAELTQEIDAAQSNVISFAQPALAAAEEAEPAFQFRWRWAAAVIALCAGGWWIYYGTAGGWQSYSTAVGEQRSVPLADGSRVYINTGSRIEVRLSPQARDIRLVAGEALFDVQADPVRPFRVHSADSVVQAVGTQFNVYQHEGTTTVSVLEGKVRISPQSADKAAPDGGTLAAGEQANVLTKGKITRRAHADMERVTAWRQRRLVFADDTLADIVAQFNRYNETPKIRVEDAAAGARRYAAGFDADDPESLVQFLAKDPTLEIERQNGALIIRSH